MAEHTKGPWELDGDIWAMNLDVVYGSGRIAMMECENDEVDDDELLANARLICAAPDMFEALVWLVEMFADHTQYDEEGYETAAVEAARSAIAKARGE